MHLVGVVGSLLSSGTSPPSLAASHVTAAPHTSFLYTCFLGGTYGVMHVIGPDHLGTLVALSAGSSPRRAFTVGAVWSLSHCLGMVVIAGVLLLLRRVTKVNVDTWEHIGDYVIGVSLMLCGLYFVANEGKYLEEGKDGSLTLAACECFKDSPGNYGAIEASGSDSDSRLPMPMLPHRQRVGSVKLNMRADFSPNMRADFSPGVCDDACCPLEAHDVASSQSDVGGRTAPDSKETDHNLTASVLGIFQGMCCPMGLVGITFMANLPGTGVVAFLLSFLLVSALGTGAAASCWAVLVRGQACTPGFSKVMYRCSCILTFLVGLAWVIANACGYLDMLNYAEHHEDVTISLMQEFVHKFG